ncbi:TPA: hypothetical protein DEB00_02950 [Candidatus Uhrbacteria bacterium]|nr:hypothetical protein [Candidatus Uhrbacteria bacterium]
MLHRIKKVVPASWLRPYHYLLAQGAAVLYCYPSKRMQVIGVTGTNGKSSTTQLIGQLLIELGETVGWTTTDSFRVADQVLVNKQKMTMLGRTQTQQMLHRMWKAHCRYVIVEVSSQGIEQFRHVGIQFDTAVFTNLTPEHLEAHGGFENYKTAKQRLFEAVAVSAQKILKGKRIPKCVVVNLNDAHAKEMAAVNVDRVVGFARADRDVFDVRVDDMIEASEITHTRTGTRARIRGGEVSIPLLGAYYFENVLAAITTVTSLGFSLSDVLAAAENVHPIPGRLERFSYKGADIIVDYAPEPYALIALYEAVSLLHPKRIIHVTGSAGGGRDVARRAQIGALASKKDTIVIVTNEDPYDDDPLQIIRDVAQGAIDGGMVEGKNIFCLLDRQEAIQQAIDAARSGDVVLITGKGSEPVMAVAQGRKIPWDDRDAVRKAIAYAEHTA